MAPLRLDRLLANSGHASRSGARALVHAGRVAVRGHAVRDPSAKAEPFDVTLDGHPLDAPAGLFVAFHKPVGFVCSHDDRDGPRVWDLLPPRWLDRTPRPSTVGRLDKDSSGLLLVTDLPALVHQLTAPRQHVPKVYEVQLDTAVADADDLVACFASGALVLRGDPAPCRPAELAVGAGGACRVVLTEGRHRQVRRMFGACGYRVVTLTRTAVGPYVLDDLAEGDWRTEDPARIDG